MEPGGREVRLEYLRPAAVREAVAACPVLYQPLGTIEWHGEQNVLGVDSLKAHELCVRAARLGGGLVAPAHYGGVGGLKEPFTWVIEPDDQTFAPQFGPWLEKLCMEAKRNGFRGVIVLTGHYGAGQQMVVRDVAVRMSRTLGIPVLGTPEYLLALDAGYTGDHAAWGETSLMMELFPDSVDLGALGEAPHQGVWGRDPKAHATRADGARLTAVIVDRLAAIARAMPVMDAGALSQFIAAEASLVGRQMELHGQTGDVWTAWRTVWDKGGLAEYGRLLAEGHYGEIPALVEKL